MNTRFSPSLNGSLHLGHLWMAWLNWAWAKQENGRFILRFDDFAPACCGEDMTKAGAWADEGERLLRVAGVIPDAISFVSAYAKGTLPGIDDPAQKVGGVNTWRRAPALEGWQDVGAFPGLVAARVRADIGENIDCVIRGEELVPELQLYEYLNHLLGGPPRRLIFLPRLRVRTNRVVTTLSKTHGNLQLRDLYAQDAPEIWRERVKAACLRDSNAPLSLDNIVTDPIIEVA